MVVWNRCDDDDRWLLTSFITTIIWDVLISIETKDNNEQESNPFEGVWNKIDENKEANKGVSVSLIQILITLIVAIVSFQIGRLDIFGSNGVVENGNNGLDNGNIEDNGLNSVLRDNGIENEEQRELWYINHEW